MRTRLLTTGLLLLNLAACSKEQEKKAETPPPAAPASTPTQAQQPQPPPGTPTGTDAQANNTGTGTQATPPPPTETPEPAAPATGGKEHAASPVQRSRPPAEKPGPWQTKALNGQELYATLDTNQGTVVVKLFSKESPVTVANFVGLATGEQTWTDPKTGEPKQNTPLYQNILFHRIIDGFMIQGGDPLGRGSGSPGYTFEDETQNGKTFDKPGILAMANRGPNTNGSQFFITVAPQPRLNGGYTIFGEVVKGYDVVERMAKVQTGPQDRPVKDVVLKKVTVSDKQPK
jgi:peptidyl-prolyl cis-trans isomerase A (cyclophilin A)